MSPVWTLKDWTVCAAGVNDYFIGFICTRMFGRYVVHDQYSVAYRPPPGAKPVSKTDPREVAKQLADMWRN